MGLCEVQVFQASAEREEHLNPRPLSPLWRRSVKKSLAGTNVQPESVLRTDRRVGVDEEGVIDSETIGRSGGLKECLSVQFSWFAQRKRLRLFLPRIGLYVVFKNHSKERTVFLVTAETNVAVPVLFVIIITGFLLLFPLSQVEVENISQTGEKKRITSWTLYDPKYLKSHVTIWMLKKSVFSVRDKK